MGKNKIEIILLIIGLVSALICGAVYEISNLNSKITDLESELEIKNTVIKNKNEQIKKIGKSDKQEEISQNIENLTTKVADLTNQKENLEKQIESLKSDAIKLKGKPKQYPAGQLTAGTDIPTGKYKIYGGNSNFIVRSSYGKLRVNIILGSRLGVDEYVYTFEVGDKIEASSSFKLVAVE
ncbi:MAG TPA: hypothetical protein OIM45_08240 [Clostridiaceae bacterium]|nr:hypothetical protein [Clostridiaceae bacterium]